MEEIKVGEYVRTKDGIIDKIFKFDEILNEYWCEKGLVIDPENKIGTHLKDIVNHSFNIKELIEEGDYVNGQRVLCLKKNNDECRDDIGTSYIDGIDIYLGYDEADIKTILTHEQYERISYRLGDN